MLKRFWPLKNVLQEQMCSDIYFQPINQWIFSYVICNQPSRQTEVLIAPSTSLVMGRTIRNDMGGGGGGGGGGGNFEPQEFFRYQTSCMIFLGHSINFLSFNFPLGEYFLFFARPPHKFSNGPSLRVCPSENQAGDDVKTTISTTSWSQTSLTKVDSFV